MRFLILLLLTISLFKIINCKLKNVETIDDVKVLKKKLRTKINVLILYENKDRDGVAFHDNLDAAAKSMEGLATILRVVCGDAKKLCKQMKVSPATYVLMHYKDGKQHKEYDRKNSLKSIMSFLEDPTGEIPWSEDESASDIIHMETIDDLRNIVTKKSNFPLLIMFYAPWCGFCKRMKPDFAAAATELKSKAILAAVNADKPQAHDFSRVFNITGYPTLYYIEDGKQIKYSGENTKDGIIKWMANPTAEVEAPKEEESSWESEGTDVVFLKSSNFKEFMAKNPSVLIMFYAPWCGHCKQMKPAYAEVAAKLKSESIPGVLAAVDATKEKELGEEFKIKGFPTVKYFKDGQYQFDVNERTSDKLLEFMKDPKEPPPPPPEEKPWKETPSAVVHPESSEFKNFLKKKKHVLVMFYAPWCGHCKKAKPEFTAAAEAMKDNTKVAFAAVDCTTSESICSSVGVTGYPTFKYYNYGKTSKDYSMGREEEDFIAFMTDPQNPKKPGQKRLWKSIPNMESLLFMDNSNFADIIAKRDGVLVMFYAPWCGHCTKMKPAFAEAGARVQRDFPSMGLGVIDATEEQSLSEQYGVSGFPTLVFVKSDGSHENYSGGRGTEDLINFIQKKHASIKGAADDDKKRLAEEKKKAEEEKKKKAEEEKAKKAEENRKRKAEEEKKRKSDEEKKKSEENRKRKTEEEKKKADEEKKRKADEEKKKAEENRKRKAEEEKKKDDEEKKRKADEEKRKKVEEEKKKSGEEKKKKEDAGKKSDSTSVSFSSIPSESDFKTQVQSFTTSLLLFYRPKSDANVKNILQRFEKVANDKKFGRYKSLLFGTVDCDKLLDLCDSQEIATSPVVRYYKSGVYQEVYNNKVNVEQIDKFLSARQRDEL